jgi:hypothetical protein
MQESTFRKRMRLERLEILAFNGIDLETANRRKTMEFAERGKTARLECERDGVDPDAPFVDDRGETTVCDDNGELFPNHEFYDLVLGGFARRPVKKGCVS